MSRTLTTRGRGVELLELLALFFTSSLFKRCRSHHRWKCCGSDHNNCKNFNLNHIQFISMIFVSPLLLDRERAVVVVGRERTHIARRGKLSFCKLVETLHSAENSAHHSDT